MRVGLFPFKPGGNPYQSLVSKSLEAAGVEVVKIPPRKIFPLHFALSHPIDILHMDWPHDWYTGKNILSTVVKIFMYFQGLRRLRTFPCVWTVHNLTAHDATEKTGETRLIQALIDCCDGLMVMSRAAERSLRDIYTVADTTVVEVIPHGHYIDVYGNDVSQTEARLELGLEESSRVVLSLGRILPYKGIDELVKGFCQVARKGDVLIVAGPGSDEVLVQNLQALADHRCPGGANIIIKPGFVPEDRLQYYFNACDLVAFPFRDILNSGSILLAMSFGKCIVAPKTGSIPEIVFPGGFFGYDQNDQFGLIAALDAAFNCPNRSALEDQVLRYTRENYGWENIGNRMSKMYDRIMGKCA